MKSLFLLLSLLCMTMLYSCGGANASGPSGSSGSSGSSSSSSAATQNGITATPAGAFTGTWTGYVENTWTAVTFQANGTITISSYTGETTATRILITQNGAYYIVDPSTKTITSQVKVSGSVLTIYYVGGGSVQLNKN